MNELGLTDATRRRLLLGGCAAAASLALPCDEALGADDTRALIPVREGIWRTQNGPYFGLLIETVDGMIVFDSLNRDFAGWLNAEIATRFAKPVKYLVYSHNHWDHVSGGHAFDAHDPVTICQELAANSILRMRLDTRLPTQTFLNRLDFELGGRRVELRYHGRNDGLGSISLTVPDRQVFSAIDWLVIGRLPYRYMARYDAEGVIRSLREILKLDWEIACPGHADMGGKARAAITLRYLETIRDGVVEGIVENTPQDVVVKDLRAILAADSDFSSLAQFDAWVEDNIRGIYAQIARIEGRLDGSAAQFDGLQAD